MSKLQPGVYIFERCHIEDEEGIEEVAVLGCIIYTPGNFMSVQIRWGDGRIASYCGPYSIDIKHSLVHHHIDQGGMDVAGTMADPSTQVRKFEILEGDSRIRLKTVAPVTIDGRTGMVELTARLTETFES